MTVAACVHEQQPLESRKEACHSLKDTIQALLHCLLPEDAHKSQSFADRLSLNHLIQTMCV